MKTSNKFYRYFIGIDYNIIAYRLFIIADELEQARDLVYYFKGELRDASIRLYHAREYKTSLKYLGMWLETAPNDKEIQWFKARCLTHLGHYKEAEKELNDLQKARYAPYKVDFAWGLLYKNQNDIKKANKYFERALKNRPEYIPLLRNYAESFESMGDLKRALEIYDYAYSLSPRDTYIAPKRAHLLHKLGRYEEALSIMNGLLIAFPENAIYHHTASIISEAQGNLEDAYSHAKKAVELDNKLYEAILRLASLELRRGNIYETKTLLNDIPIEEHSKRPIVDTIRAEILLKEGKLTEARELLFTQKPCDAYCSDVLARIELKEAMNILYINNDPHLAKEKVQKGINICVSALDRNPNHHILNRVLRDLQSLRDEIDEESNAIPFIGNITKK